MRAHAPATVGKTGFIAAAHPRPAAPDDLRRRRRRARGHRHRQRHRRQARPRPDRLPRRPRRRRQPRRPQHQDGESDRRRHRGGGRLAAPADLAAVATQIQNAAQGAPSNLADFRASVSGGRLLLRVEGGDATDIVIVTGGTAIADLGLTMRRRRGGEARWLWTTRSPSTRSRGAPSPFLPAASIMARPPRRNTTRPSSGSATTATSRSSCSPATLDRGRRQFDHRSAPSPMPSSCRTGW